MARMVFIAAIMVILVSFCNAQEINGKWNGQMQSPNGAMEMSFTFKAAGDSLTGVVASPMGEIPISNGKIKGNNFTFDVNVGEMVINHQCTFMKDSISLKVPGMEGEPMEMILKRAAESK